MQKFKVKREWYSSHFSDFLKSKNRYQILFGGRGSGKTHHIILKLIAISFISKYNHIVYVNKVFGDIRKNQFKDIIKILKATNLIEYFTINRTNYGFKNNITGTEFTALGMDNAENTKGLSDPTIIWWDEINKGTQDDFTTLNALLRTPLNPNYQFIISFNPVSETSWLRTYFFEKENAYKIRADFKDVYLNHSNYANNDFIDKDKYLESLTLNSIGNQNKMLVDVKGLWGLVDIKNPFFYALRRNIHFSDERYSMPDNTQIYLSFDFNKSPSTLLIGMVYNKEIAIIDLICCDENTVHGFSPLEACCTKFKQKYLDSGLITRPYIIVTGDASGAAGGADKVKNDNFYTKIERMLGVSKSQIKLRKKNIEHILSQEICNTLIYNCNFKIYKSAELVLLDMEMAQIKDSKLVKGSRDKGEGLDITDAVRYFIDCILHFEQWQNYIKHYARKETN